MSLTVNAKTYVTDGTTKDAVSYAGPLNTLSVKDIVRLARTAPKPTSTFSGVARSQAKLTRTLPLTAALTPTADAILDIQAQVPVGAVAADIDTICNDMGAYVASASFKSLLKNLLITY
jgi:hypothetical protein